MTDQIIVDQFSYWRAAFDENGSAVREIDTERGNPRSGFYRLKGEAIAFWRLDGSDEVLCWRSGGKFTPRDADEADELFGWCAPHPVTHAAYKFFVAEGRWPDEVAPVEVPADLTPDKAVAAELKAYQDTATAWLADLGRKPSCKEEADKAANYAAKFGEIEGRAEKARVAEKEPHLLAGREIDAKYAPTREAAKQSKVWANGLADDYAKAERAKREAEVAAENARRLATFKAEQEAQAAIDAERAADAQKIAAAGIEIPTPPAPIVVAPKLVVAEKVMLGTVGRRQSIKSALTYTITDATLLLEYLAKRNFKSEALLAAALADAKKLAEVGTEVPGFKVGSVEGVR